MTAFDEVNAARETVARRLAPTGLSPRVGIVLGSGLSPLASELERTLRIPYADIPGMPVPSVIGHQGELLCGSVAGVDVVCLSGRAHLYEGHAPDRVVFGVRLLASLGVSCVLLTNAAGGIAPDCGPGTLMLISDHLNLTGTTPLLGPNEDRWGTRFPDMSDAYSKGLRQLADEAAAQEGIDLKTGVYAGLLGPTYETPAEIRMLETMGASAVGMSTVLETIALRHQQLGVIGISCITNLAAGKSAQTLNHAEVAEVAAAAGSKFVRLVRALLPRLAAAP